MSRKENKAAGPIGVNPAVVNPLTDDGRTMFVISGHGKELII